MKLIIVTALVALAAAAPNTRVFPMGQWKQPRVMDIVEVCESLGLNTLANVLTRAGLVDTLKGPGPFTVFAPTDDAFAMIPEQIMARWMGDMNELKDVLLYHVSSGKDLSGKLTNDMMLPSMCMGYNIRFNMYPMTSMATVNGCPITMPDQNATNGVVHVISRVMWPQATMDIMDNLGFAQNMPTLVKAIEAAGLTDTLKGGPFTLFAPSEEAFMKLPPGTLENLLKDIPTLKRILTYHVLPDVYFQAGFMDGWMPKTVEGAMLNVKMMPNSQGAWMINNAQVTWSDNPATNGAIHVIDTVMMPPSVHYKLV